MPRYFSIIVDKSTLQGINAREAEWLFRVNIPPVLFHEIIGDLHKTDARKLSTGSGIGDVKMLASKIDDSAIDLNAESYQLIVAELKGMTFEIDDRPVVGNAQRIKDPKGGYGIYVDQGPTQDVMERWRAGDFEGMEIAFARLWRTHLENINLEEIIAATKPIRDKTRSTPDSIMELIESLIFKPNENYTNLKNG